jgi:hypothetical protein
LHLALVHKVHRVKPDLKGSKGPQDHLGRQGQQDLRGQKATEDRKVLPVQPVYLVQRFI